MPAFSLPPLSMKSRDISVLATALSYSFSSPNLLQQALTHSSYAREIEASAEPGSETIGDNEQLEFLGDAVLSLVTSDEIYRRFPGFREGDLSKLRAHLVSEKHLVQVARKLTLGQFLRLGRGEEKSGGRLKTTLLADALEAIFGAVYLDGGLESSRGIILRYVVHPELEELTLNGSILPLTDYKSALQEKLQAVGLPQPAYLLLSEQGPEHRKTFTVEARLRNATGDKFDVVGRAEGTTKKSAEQEAARQVLNQLATLPKPLAASPQRKRHA